MVFGKLPVPGHSMNLVNSRARAYCTCIRCEWGLFGHFFSIFSPSFLPLWETSQYRLKYCLKGPLNPKQPTNQFRHPYRCQTESYRVPVSLGITSTVCINKHSFFLAVVRQHNDIAISH